MPSAGIGPGIVIAIFAFVGFESAGSLGVECEFCHSSGPDGRLQFDKDGKKEKKTAREMMRMMLAINHDNFKGEREVTCNTCHRGDRRPN